MNTHLEQGKESNRRSCEKIRYCSIRPGPIRGKLVFFTKVRFLPNVLSYFNYSSQEDWQKHTTYYQNFNGKKVLYFLFKTKCK